MANHHQQKIKRILFVCLGNICRSPAAEGIMKHMVKENGMEGRIEVDSAGLGPWHVGELPDDRMVLFGKRHGYRFDSRARMVVPGDFDKFDLIIPMDDNNLNELKTIARSPYDLRKLIPMSRFLRHHPMYNTVPDPYYGTDHDFELVIHLLEDACQGLLDELTKA